MHAFVITASDEGKGFVGALYAETKTRHRPTQTHTDKRLILRVCANLCRFVVGALKTFLMSVSVCVCLWQIMELNDITYKINAAIFEINRELGAVFLEKIYENALLMELRHMGLKAEKQVPIKVTYKGQEVGEYFADIVVENQVILELKAVESLQKVHEAQLLNYLKATGMKIGLLVNFTYPKAVIKRFIL